METKLLFIIEIFAGILWAIGFWIFVVLYWVFIPIAITVVSFSIAYAGFMVMLHHFGVVQSQGNENNSILMLFVGMIFFIAGVLLLVLAYSFYIKPLLDNIAPALLHG